MDDVRMDTDTRLDSLVHYVCARCDNPSELDATKLNKILWYSDVFAFATYGRSITGAVYVKRQFGPVPKDIRSSRARLVDSGAIFERMAMHHGYPQTQFIALSNPDISMFGPEQISLVDKVVETVCSNTTARPASRASHDGVWESAEIGEEIPMAAAAFAGNFGELDEDDLAWAKKEIDRIEATHDLR
jgi:hypothetical protein